MLELWLSWTVRNEVRSGNGVDVFARRIVPSESKMIDKADEGKGPT
jgi:hypothetical protein